MHADYAPAKGAINGLQTTLQAKAG